MPRTPRTSTPSWCKLVESELGSDWARKVAPSFDERRAVLLDDRWASVREDFARVWIGDDEARERSFAGLDEAASAQAGWWLDRARGEAHRPGALLRRAPISAADGTQEWSRRGGRGHRRCARLDRRRRRGRPAPWRCHGRRDHLAAGQGAPRVLPQASTATTRRPVPPCGCCRPTSRRSPTSTRSSSGSPPPWSRPPAGRRPSCARRSSPTLVFPFAAPAGPGHGGRRRLARRGRVPHPAVGCRAPGHRPGGPGCRPPDRPPRARRAAGLAQPWPLRRRRCVRRGQGRVRRLRHALARREGLGASASRWSTPTSAGSAAPA